jgi:hypothetical protein
MHTLAGEQLPAQALLRLSMATEVDPGDRLLEVRASIDVLTPMCRF